MEHKIAKYLFDIFESIQSIESYLGNNKDYNEYSKNKLLRRGIERELEIIGEALSSLKKLDNSIEISFYKQIIRIKKPDYSQL